VLVEDLEYFFNRENEIELMEKILKNTKRYIKLLYEAIDKLMPKSRVKKRDDEIDTVEEIVMNHRIQNLTHNNVDENIKKNEKLNLPPELLRK
jgi:hypothetical protein